MFTHKVHTVISVSIGLLSIASIVLSPAIFVTADTIALKIFHIPELALPLKIFAAGVPFFTLIQVLVAIFRGFDQIDPQIIFNFIVLNILFLAFLPIVIATGLPFVAVFSTYLAALIITFIALLTYTAKKLPPQMSLVAIWDATPITKELLLFSLPLLGVVMLTLVRLWIDTLMLGYFKTSEAVGLYNAAHPLIQSISVPSYALLLIYNPIVTGHIPGT